MKIVLSRKGFDSKYGGYPSPILPDRNMISLPIPDYRDSIKYSNLKIDKSENYFLLMKRFWSNRFCTISSFKSSTPYRKR